MIYKQELRFEGSGQACEKLLGAKMKKLIPFTLLLYSMAAAAQEKPCGTLAYSAIESDFHTSSDLAQPRTLRQRHGSERLLVDMGDCPQTLVSVVGESLKSFRLDVFVQVWRDDLERGLDCNHRTPGLQAGIERALKTPAPPQTNVWQSFTDQLRLLAPKRDTPVSWSDCGPLVTHTMKILATEYEDAYGESGADLMAYLLWRLNTCPEVALSAMRWNPELLTRLVSAGHDSPFWGEIEELAAMRELKKQLVLGLRRHRPSPVNTKVYDQLLKGLENVCIRVIDHQELSFPCPLDDTRTYTPMTATPK